LRLIINFNLAVISNMDTNNLLQLRERITEIRSNTNITEAQTKEWLIRPFFELLGWQFSNWAEVVPEDGDEAGKRTDYCFYHDKVPKLLIEAKSLRNNLNDQQMIINKLNYCSNRNIPILILTNGDTYKVFFNEIPGIGSQKLLFEFTLSGNTEEDNISKLQKEFVQSDELLKYARKITVVTNVKTALDQLFLKQDIELIKLINRNLQSMIGHKFHADEIKNALKSFKFQLDSGINLFQTPHFEQAPLQKEIQPFDSPMIYTEEQLFKDGVWKKSFEKYKILMTALNESGLQFELNPKKKYIAFVSEKNNFAQVGALEEDLKIWVKLKFEQLNDEEKKIARDVSSIGHHGLGDVELRFKSEADLETVIRMIGKAYNI
jgi:predicted transport protein/predicted type IV restriction endonuclease